MTVSSIVASAALSLLVVERARPARRLPHVEGFFVRAALASAAQAGAVYLAGITWDPWMAAHRPFSLTQVPTWAGALVGYIAITFVYYFWHRARHEVPVLWRLLHRTHHSPVRLEVLTSFYKHPLEIVANGLLSSGVLYLLCGLTPAAAAIAVVLTGLAELFYHWNVRTPHWLGYLIQRPEMHRLHHARGHHRDNYSDLPLWDLLFGTFHNPREDVWPCGFAHGAERHLGALLLGRDARRGREQP
jgi:sterol desaturase/sphingolipid hydroxylase (fatty acid hydroxylase superfamily)